MSDASPRFFPRRTYTWTLLAITLLAFALRAYRLDGQSLWYDEGVTALVSQFDLPSLTRWTADDIQPPLYYILVAGWGRLAGWSEWSLRFPSLFFGAWTVPLMAALATRLTRRRTAGLLAGLLTALHPLLLYYSQEARMYALLLALAVLAGLLALDGDRTRSSARSRSWRPWLAYTLVATAAVYTHYFAFFLLLALAGAAFLDALLGRGQPLAARFRARLLPLLAADLAVLLLYLPWLRVLVTQLQVDTSYWTGSLKLWEALRHVAISFTSGETVLEAEATQRLALYGVIAGIALFEALRPITRRPAPDTSPGAQTPLFALAWLLVPVAGVLALASVTPKFNSRYVMVALPGLLLLWSDGLGRLLEARNPTGETRGHRLWRLRPLAGALLVLGLLTGFGQADANWFTDPAFTKDQWRELAAYVRANRAADEAVVLVSGHAWPVWHYYAPELEPLRLPAIDVLDVNAVLDFPSSGAPLRQALAGKWGVWLVGWQDQVVDPMGVTPLLLEMAGQEQPVEGAFWGLKLRHFIQLKPEEIPVEPPVQVQVDANFENQVTLLGATVRPDGELLLFWRRTGPDPLPDLRVTGETLTEDGLLYAKLRDRRPAGYLYPAFRWPQGQVTVGRIPPADWVGEGAPAGVYQLQVGLYDPAGDLTGLDVLDQAGNPQGKRATIQLRLPVTIPMEPSGDPSAAWHEIAPGIYVDATLVPKKAPPGATLTLELRWYAAQDSWVRHVFGYISSLPGRPSREGLLPEDWVPLDLFLPGGQVVRTLRAIRMPPGTLASEFWLHFGLPEFPRRSLEFSLERTGVEGVDAPTPSITWPLDAQFGDELRILGLSDLTPKELATPLKPGGELALYLVWEMTRLPREKLALTVQWLGPDGRPAAQRDMELPRFTNQAPGEADTLRLSLPVPEEPGEYTLILAVYRPDEPGLPRLLLPDGRDALELDTVTVR